ncbi:Pr6Pr family membrane protein [Aliiroseovarius sp. PTFE2010]|uniref:Pr6Pr family membrane protein n=1 Tax=Aliiroseovarius sp. PTFE2010 TaxID=3417190 RepID=UPI003CE91231
MSLADRSTRAQRISAAALAVTALAAILSQLTITIGDHPGMSVLGGLWINLRYFTILTNGIVAATFGYIAFSGRLVSAGWLTGVTLWIAIVGVVYHLLLADFAGKSRLGLITDHGLHTVVPAATAMWWLFLAPKRALQWRLALWWLLWPAGYLVYALIRASMDGVYPYFFVNLPKLGWGGFAYWCAVLMVTFTVAGLGLIGLARALAPRRA